MLSPLFSATSMLKEYGQVHDATHQGRHSRVRIRKNEEIANKFILPNTSFSLQALHSSFDLYCYCNTYYIDNLFFIE